MTARVVLSLVLARLIIGGVAGAVVAYAGGPQWASVATAVVCFVAAQVEHRR